MRNHTRHLIFSSGGFAAGFTLLISCGILPGQTNSAVESGAAPAPMIWTAAQDHQNMMEQLGITKLRPGPSGQVNAPDAANYDQAKANPYPDYPDALTLKNGQKVTSAEMWRKQRRPEIVEDFEREVIGRVPNNVPKVTWEIVTQATDRVVGGIPVIAKQLVGHVDNSACPAIKVDIQMTLVTPANVKGPVPVLMMFVGFGGSGLPRRAGEAAPTGFGSFGGGGFGRGPAGTNAAGTNAFPRGGLAAGGGTNAPGRGRGGFGGGGPSSTEMLISNGWGYATISPGSIQDDSGGGRGSSPGGLTRGIIGLVNKGQPRKPDDWGSLRAWAWGAARGLDYLETDSTVDARHVGIEGVSRYGKAALVTMAFEPRFAMVLVGSSGEGGAKPHRRNFGEAVENLTGSGEYHWMAGNFLKYGAAEAMFGGKNANDLPVDSHELIALCAPRFTFISYGLPERGDANWLDQQGSYMATVAAGPVFRLLGAKDIGDTNDYHVAKMPPFNTGLLDGELAWRQHDGGHEDQSNMKYFIAWANKLMHYAPAK
jgi:hypothetical protein